MSFSSFVSLGRIQFTIRHRKRAVLLSHDIKNVCGRLALPQEQVRPTAGAILASAFIPYRRVFTAREHKPDEQDGRGFAESHVALITLKKSSKTSPPQSTPEPTQPHSRLRCRYLLSPHTREYRRAPRPTRRDRTSTNKPR